MKEHMFILNATLYGWFSDTLRVRGQFNRAAMLLLLGQRLGNETIYRIQEWIESDQPVFELTFEQRRGTSTITITRDQS